MGTWCSWVAGSRRAVGDVRVVVTGSRTWWDWELLTRTLSSLDPQVTGLAHGGAAGADERAAWWAASHKVATTVFEADWSKGRRAGPIRNKRMLTEFRPDLVVAFWDGESPGTKNCVDQAHRLGIPVQVVQRELAGSR